LFGESLPQPAGTIHITTTEVMGPRLRGDDQRLGFTSFPD
jgi:hypothetical protein